MTREFAERIVAWKGDLPADLWYEAMSFLLAERGPA
jgi:hypothetical protein